MSSWSVEETDSWKMSFELRVLLSTEESMKCLGEYLREGGAAEGGVGVVGVHVAVKVPISWRARKTVINLTRSRGAEAVVAAGRD
jgi:hypothetical protein